LPEPLIEIRGLLPAIRAARLPVTVALRTL
jgi:hypothetical protein